MPSGGFDPRDRNLYETLAGAQVITGAAFWSVAVWGIIDAHYNFEGPTVKGERRLPRESLEAPAAWGATWRVTW